VLGKVETRVGIFVLAAVGILIYMGFKVGAFRFDRMRYASYTVFFEDVSGLTRKAEVRIAGVKVGWVDKIRLEKDATMRAGADIMVLKGFNLYDNAHAVVRQDGLLGAKFVEIIPGDPLLTKLGPGGELKEPSVKPANVDEILLQVRDIAGHVEDVTKSFKDVIGGVKGEQQLRTIFDNLQQASERFASVSGVIDRSLSRNEDSIDALLKVGENIKKLTDKIDQNILPVFQESIEKISGVFDRDFDRVASKIGETADALSEASIQARDSLSHIGSVTEKIDEGKGLLGKIINEDETYNDLRVAAEGIKNYFSKVDQLQIIFDAHTETMQRPAENFRFEDSKGYFDIRIHPNEDYFYLLQLASSAKGYVNRKEVIRSYADDCNNVINTDALNLTDRDRLRFVFRKKKEKIKRHQFRLGLQFGKIFGPTAVRFGLFEGYAGLGMDLDIPLIKDKLRWVTSLEGFDFIGWNRINDRRPHLKWINRIFIFKNIYTTFGADDFISKHNANAFFGAGIRFGDDDIKYYASSLGGVGGVASVAT